MWVISELTKDSFAYNSNEMCTLSEFLRVIILVIKLHLFHPNILLPNPLLNQFLNTSYESPNKLFNLRMNDEPLDRTSVIQTKDGLLEERVGLSTIKTSEYHLMSSGTASFDDCILCKYHNNRSNSFQFSSSFPYEL